MGSLRLHVPPTPSTLVFFGVLCRTSTQKGILFTMESRSVFNQKCQLKSAAGYLEKGGIWLPLLLAPVGVRGHVLNLYGYFEASRVLSLCYTGLAYFQGSPGPQTWPGAARLRKLVACKESFLGFSPFSLIQLARDSVLAFIRYTFCCFDFIMFLFIVFWGGGGGAGVRGCCSLPEFLFSLSECLGFQVTCRMWTFLQTPARASLHSQQRVLTPVSPPLGVPVANAP